MKTKNWQIHNRMHGLQKANDKADQEDKSCPHAFGARVEGNRIYCAEPTCNKLIGFVRDPRTLSVMK